MEAEYVPPRKKRKSTPPVVRRCSKCRFLVLSHHKTHKARIHTIYKPKLGRLDPCSGSHRRTKDPAKSKGPNG